jgi:glycosyltransferase involved in cell wall biosynthesis
MKLSVVMASMNEVKSIVHMIEEIRKYAPDGTEILIVDSSTDATPNIAKSMGARVIAQSPQGHGMALKKALNEASGDIVITTDCDLTYPMNKIPEFIELIEGKGYDIVSGCRLTKELSKEMPPANKLANIVFACIVRLLYRINTHDVTTGMFAMRKELAQTKWEGNFSLPAEIIIRSKLMGKKYLEVPITYKLRAGDSTLPKWRSGKAYLRCFFHWKFGWFKGEEL